jgi:diacylglycerol kinase family enzyme
VLVTSQTPFPVQVDGDSLGDHRRLEVDLAPEALWVVA